MEEGPATARRDIGQHGDEKSKDDIDCKEERKSTEFTDEKNLRKGPPINLLAVALQKAAFPVLVQFKEAAATASWIIFPIEAQIWGQFPPNRRNWDLGGWRLAGFFGFLKSGDEAWAAFVL